MSYFIADCIVDNWVDNYAIQNCKRTIDAKYKESKMIGVYIALYNMYDSCLITRSQKYILRMYLKKNRNVRRLAYKFIYNLRHRLFISKGAHNEFDLDFATLPHESNHVFRIHDNSKWWWFDISNILKYITTQLKLCCIETAEPTPMTPKNVWTNNDLRGEHYIALWMYCEEHNIKIPEILHMFKAAHYNVPEFRRVFVRYLCKKISYMEYIHSVDSKWELIYILDRINGENNYLANITDLREKVHDIPFDVLKREMIRLMENPYSNISIAPIVRNSNILLMGSPLYESDVISKYEIQPLAHAHPSILPKIEWHRGRELRNNEHGVRRTRNRRAKRKR